MKFNKLTASTIVSIVLFGSVGQFAINASPVEALEARESITIAAKSKSLIASGNFVTSEKNTSGKAKIVNINGQRYLELDRAFRTARGPQVEIVLHENTRTPNSLSEGNYITLGRIKSFRGKQLYAIPENVNLANYKSVGVWCRKFNTTFGFASLTDA